MAPNVKINSYSAKMLLGVRHLTPGDMVIMHKSGGYRVSYRGMCCQHRR